MICSKHNRRVLARAQAAPGIASAELIGYGFKTCGSPQERARIRARWTSDIGSK